MGNSMSVALIGHSGFVGSTLKRQADFDALYRSTDIDGIRGHAFDLVICAGAPAQKWLANREPEADKRNMERLIDALRNVRCREFVLISTVDVFKDPRGVDESTQPDDNGLHPYGANRLWLERFVQDQFEAARIVRLPGLVGPGLKKNIIFDLHHGNAVSAIDSRSVFQFYPMVNLWTDLVRTREAGLNCVHLTAEPLSVAEIALQGFGIRFEQVQQGCPAHYDFQSRHAGTFGAQGRYTYSARETMLAVRAYAQSEPKAGAGAAQA